MTLPFVFYGNQQTFWIIYWSIVLCFPICVCVLQNEYVFIVKSFKYDYWFSESLGCGLVIKWSVVSWSVSRWSVDLIRPRKKMFGLVISSVHFDRGLFCYSNCNFYYIDNKEEIKLITRSSQSNLQLFLKTYRYYNFE